MFSGLILLLGFRRFWGCVKRFVLDDVGFFVVNAIAVNIDLHLQFEFFARRVRFGQVVGERVLISQQRVDVIEVIRGFACKGHRIMNSAGFFGKSVHLILRLQKCQTVRFARPRIRRVEVIAVFFAEKICRADDIEWNSGFLDDAANFVVSAPAESIYPRSDENDRLSP